MADRKVLHIVAGDDNWTPTMEQLEEIRNMFMACTMDEKGGVIVTRNAIEFLQEQPSVKIRVIDFDPGNDLLKLAANVIGE